MASSAPGSTTAPAAGAGGFIVAATWSGEVGAAPARLGPPAAGAVTTCRGRGCGRGHGRGPAATPTKGRLGPATAAGARDRASATAQRAPTVTVLQIAGVLIQPEQGATPRLTQRLSAPGLARGADSRRQMTPPCRRPHPYPRAPRGHARRWPAGPGLLWGPPPPPPRGHGQLHLGHSETPPDQEEQDLLNLVNSYRTRPSPGPTRSARGIWMAQTWPTTTTWATSTRTTARAPRLTDCGYSPTAPVGERHRRDHVHFRRYGALPPGCSIPPSGT